MEEIKIENRESMPTIGGVPAGLSTVANNSDLPDYAKWPKGKQLDYENLEQIYNGIHSSEKSFDDYGKLEIQHHGTKDPELCDILSRYKLPNIRVIGMMAVDTQKASAIEFLKNSIPDEVQNVYITGDVFPPWPNLSDYISYLCLNSEKIKKEIWIRTFTVTQADIELLLENFGHLTTIGFHDCDFKDIDSDLKIDDKVEFKIKELSFEHVLTDSLKSHHFERIIKGITNCGLKDSLTRINLTKCGDDLYSMINLVSDNLKDVSVHYEGDWYYNNL